MTEWVGVGKGASTWRNENKKAKTNEFWHEQRSVSACGRIYQWGICVDLENILKITSRKFFHLQDIVMKAADRKPSKCRNLAKPISRVGEHCFRLSFIHTLCLTHPLEHLVAWMPHVGCESSVWTGFSKHHVQIHAEDQRPSSGKYQISPRAAQRRHSIPRPH